MHDRGPARLEGMLERGGEIGVRADPEAEATESLGHGCEVDWAELRPDLATREGRLLVSADRAVAAVVEDESDDRNAVPDCRLELRHADREAAVAGDGHDGHGRASELRPDRRGERVAHRAGGRAEVRPGLVEAVVTREPEVEVPGIGRDDGLWR